jgi:hypothetical protein
MAILAEVAQFHDDHPLRSRRTQRRCPGARFRLRLRWLGVAVPPGGRFCCLAVEVNAPLPREARQGGPFPVAL